jgi:hypothetical protein
MERRQRKEVNDSALWDCRLKGRGQPKLDEAKLPRVVGISAQGNSDAFGFRNSQQGKTQVLPVRVTIDFDSLAQFCRRAEDTGPIGFQSQPVVINAASRMSENLDMRISQGAQITFGLILGCAERRMK